MLQLALFGHPVAHSLSPQIHQGFARSLGLECHYQLIDTLPGCLTVALQHFRLQGGKGANVTLPLKQEAFDLCTHHTPSAQRAQAVNTLYWQAEQLWGDNTDGEGLVLDLTHNLNWKLNNKRILILGAGGAARGIIFPLLSQGATLVIVNRNGVAAQELARQDRHLSAYIPKADEFSVRRQVFEQQECIQNTRLLRKTRSQQHRKFSCEGYTYETLEQEANLAPFDLIINATSASLSETLPPLKAHWITGTQVVDLAYKLKEDTIFLKWAKTQGAQATYDGKGMLVEQAALSFYRWQGVKPSTEAILKQLRSEQ